MYQLLKIPTIASVPVGLWRQIGGPNYKLWEARHLHHHSGSGEPVNGGTFLPSFQRFLKKCAGQASAETHKLWAAELAAKAQRRVERISKKTEWASRLEAAALAEPVVRHTSSNFPATLGVRVTQYGCVGPKLTPNFGPPCYSCTLQLSAVCLAFHPPYGL